MSSAIQLIKSTPTVDCVMMLYFVYFDQIKENREVTTRQTNSAFNTLCWILLHKASVLRYLCTENISHIDCFLGFHICQGVISSIDRYSGGVRNLVVFWGEGKGRQEALNPCGHLWWSSSSVADLHCKILDICPPPGPIFFITAGKQSLRR